MKKFLLLLALVLSIIVISCNQNLYIEAEEPEIPKNIWRVGTVYFDTADKAIEYIMTNSSSRTVTKTDDEARTITLTRPVLSEDSDGIKDDTYKAYVEDDSLRGSITVPESFSGDLCIDFNGYRYDFSNNAEAFFVVSGGDNVYIYNGTSVIYNEASHVPYAIVVDTDTVTIDEHMIDDRRVDPKALDVKADGSVVITSSSKQEDTSLKGGFNVDGTLKIDSGVVYIDTVKTAEDSSFEITGGTIITTSDYSEVVENAINEEAFKKNGGDYEVSKDVVVDTETKLTSAITPANASSSATDERKTTVTIPANTKELTSGSSASLTVTAYPILEANKKFKISDDVGAVGAIDLKVRVTTKTEDGTTTTKEITCFTSDGTTAVALTVETYLTKGMSNVTLMSNDSTGKVWNATATSATEGLTVPNGSTAGVCYYDAATGKLVFKTTQFSTFVVSSDDIVVVATTDTAYKSLRAFFGKDTYKEGADVVLISNVTDTENNKVTSDNPIYLKSGTTLDLNGYTIDFTGDSTAFATATESEGNETIMTIKDGVINGKNLGRAERLIRIDRAGSSFELDNVTITTTGSGLLVANSTNNIKVNIENSTINVIGEGYYALSTNASTPTSLEVNIKISDSTLSTPNNTAVLFNVTGGITMENSEVIGRLQGMVLRGGTHSITNSTIKSYNWKWDNNKEHGNFYFTGYDNNNFKRAWQSGNNAAIGNLIIGNRSTSYLYPTTVVLNDVEFGWTEGTSKSGDCSNIFIWQNKIKSNAVHIGETTEGVTEYKVSVSGTVKGNAVSVNKEENGATLNLDSSVTVTEIDFSKAPEN